MATITDSDALSLAEGLTLAIGEAAPYGAILTDSGAAGVAAPSGPGVDSASLAEGITLSIANSVPYGATFTEVGVLSAIFPTDDITFSDQTSEVIVNDLIAEVTLADPSTLTVAVASSDLGTLADTGVVVSSIQNVITTDSDAGSLSEAAVIQALLVALDSAAFADLGIVAVVGDDAFTLAETDQDLLSSFIGTDVGTLAEATDIQATGDYISVSIASSDQIALVDFARGGFLFAGYPVGTVLIVARLNGSAHLAARLQGAAHVEV